ncbi:MAG: FAD-dependent oxidoreductase [Verrucomicrobiaceae bacterium]|nr:MAG: FAD-dependent oxidoreductase [Verrucomicrobiaceae bacterium]
MKQFLLLAAFLAPVSAAPVSYDIVVYGGTSGGVVAAVQAAKSGRSVVLISSTAHLGGLTTSGLGWTDLGESSILGGLSRDFYHRIYLHYQNSSAWNRQTRASYGNSAQGGPAFNVTTQIASVFEPKVAEAVFQTMLGEQNVPVVTGRLDLDDGVVLDGKRINYIRLEDGREFAGKMFIDASYEGDLLPGAGVSFTVGRESNSAYEEDYNGIQATRATKNQLRDGIDPYVVKGNPASGLLPGVNAGPGGTDGSADDKLQAYCFRMVLTDVAANRVMVAKPPGYNEADYELLFRAIEAGQTNDFFKFDLMPNRKTDSNNRGGISTDYIGKNYGPGWNWATLDHDERLALAKEHENWQRGMVWTLQNHPRVPQSIRDKHAAWGLPADEFTDNGNWPWQIYVREARRMVSDQVMSQRHCSGEVVVADSVGLAAYAMDSHHVQRHVKNGMVKNEGDVQMPVADPYPVSYRSIVPKSGECPNLLVPWSLSATHMAFGSIRMEPVFMILSQSAAIGADLAINDNISVQQLAYSKLRPALLAAGQALGDASAGSPAVVVDNTDSARVTITGAWTSGDSSAGFIGSNYLHDDYTGQGTKQVLYSPPAAVTGMQRVFLRWTSHTNRASNVPVRIIDSKGTRTVLVNQKNNGGKWNLLGIFSGVTSVTVMNTAANGYVVADAVGFSSVSPDDDSDDDGLSDVREIEIGLDPLVSNYDLFEAVRSRPEYFGLHTGAEVFDLHVGQPGYTPSLFKFDIRDGTSWEVFENFQLNIPQQGARRFFRVALRTEPATFVKALGAGQQRTIVVYGTSLTAGGAWVSQMNSWLSARFPGQFTVVNSGLSGKNSAEGLAQLQTKVLGKNPDTVFIEFAMNDAFLYTDGTPRLSVAQAKVNLEAMIQAIRQKNPQAEIILQTMNVVWDSPTGSNQSATLRPELASYYEMYRDVAAERGLMLIDHEANWSVLRNQSPSTFQSYVADGVHPNATGSSKVILPLLLWKLSGGNPKL